MPEIPEGRGGEKRLIFRLGGLQPGPLDLKSSSESIACDLGTLTAVWPTMHMCAKYNQ